MMCVTAIVLLLFVLQRNSVDGKNQSSITTKVKDFFDSKEFSNISKQMEFYLWTLSSETGEPIEIKLDQEKDLIIKGIEQKPLKIYTHGYNAGSETTLDFRNVYLSRINEFNIITVKWTTISNQMKYFLVVKLCIEVGMVIGYFLKNLVKEKFVKPYQIHMIGFGVAAHVAGSCGRTFFELTQTKIGRITGLDPTGPGFKGHFMSWKNEDNLNKDDAEFVDVIHTSIGTVGTSIQNGHADFYPNNGTSPQPFCKEHKSFLGLGKPFCSHETARMYYYESIKIRNSFSSVFCESKKDFMDVKCKNNTRSNMGHDADPKKHGKFYLNTNEHEPFSQSIFPTP